jgi:hypothetical protein
MHPDLAEKRATQRLGSVVLKALEEQFGDKLPPGARRDVAHKLVEASFWQAMPATPDASAGPPSGKGGASLVPLLFAVKGGKVISTNGEIDDWTGEAYWALFPEATTFAPVTMTAVLQLDAK